MERSADGSRFIFFVRKVKNQGPELLGTVGGGFRYNSDASAWVVYGIGNNGYEIKLSSAADNSAPVLGTVTADNQN